MDKIDRIFQIHSILSNRRTPIDPESLMARLECSRATMFRLIGEMKDILGAPIEFDSERGGFIYEQSPEGQRYGNGAAGVKKGGVALGEGVTPYPPCLAIRYP